MEDLILFKVKWKSIMHGELRNNIIHAVRDNKVTIWWIQLFSTSKIIFVSTLVRWNHKMKIIKWKQQIYLFAFYMIIRRIYKIWLYSPFYSNISFKMLYCHISELLCFIIFPFINILTTKTHLLTHEPFDGTPH